MQQITTVITGVPTDDDDGAARMRQLVNRDDDLAAHARAPGTASTTRRRSPVPTA